MKSMAIVGVAFALTLATVTTALAAHGAAAPIQAVPAHGSVWFGTGLERYESPASIMPLHGSVWFGDGVNALISHGS